MNANRVCGVAMLIAAAAGWVAAAGCSGGDDGGETRFGDTVCADCVQSTCSTEIASCEGSADCDATLACALDCPTLNGSSLVDGNCTDECEQQHLSTPGGAAAWGTVSQCYGDVIDTTCAGECAAN